MQRRIAVVVGLVSLVMAAAPAAFASSVPFDLNMPLNAQGGRLGVPMSQDTGLIGACDNEFRCTGFRVTAATTPADAGTTQGQLTLRGYFCVMEASAPCSANGTPFTGITITDRVVDTPEPYVTPAIVQVNFCAWAASPQSTPYACNLPPISLQPIAINDLGNIADRINEIRYGLHWID